MTHACRPLTAWRHPALPVRAAALLVCAGALLSSPEVAAQTCGDPAFGPSPVVALGGGPRGVALGDFDRGTGSSGRLDAVVVDAAGQITLLRGDGSGTLVPQTPFGALLDPRDVVAGDFNRDGRLDLAVAAAGTTRIELWSGDGLGGFTAQAPFALGVAPTRLAAADFDRNGRTDLVVVSETGNVVRVLLASGDFTFDPVTADLAVVGPSAVAVGDFNHDGWLDLAVARAAASRVQIYRGRTNLSPPPSVAFDTGASVVVTGGPVDIAVGDVDRDGRLDLVTVPVSGASSVLLGDGAAGFAETETPSVGTAPVRVALSDFDRDGDLDLVVLDGGAGAPVATVVPRVQLPSPQFDVARSASLPLPATSAPVAMALGDVRRDGRPDVLAAVSLAGAHAAITGANASGPDCPRSSFADAPRAFAAGEMPVATRAADMDGDGTPDLVVAASGPPATIEILKGSGGLYQSILSLPVTPAPPRGVAVADFDTDGDQDVVAALGNAGAGYIQLYAGNGLGGLSTGTLLPTGLNASAVVAGDFDGNGAPDVAVTSQGSNQVQIFRGNGAGAFFAPTTIPSGAAPRDLAAGDLDGNGTLDLVVANSTDATVSVFLGAGDGINFVAGPGSPHAVGNGPWGVALADFDGDLKLDLVTADHDAVPPTVTVRLGLGTGGFDVATTYPVDGFPFAVAALDLTGEGQLDIAAVTGNHTLNVLAGDGGGGFATPATIYPTRTRPSAITPVDADADGRLDLVVPCKDADSVVVFLARPLGLRQAARVAVGAKPSAAAAADFDDDGDLDLAVVNTSANTVTILTNDGAGAFSTHATVSVGMTPQAVVAADLDRDGTLDLAVSNAFAGTVSVLHGDGGADFTLVASPTAGAAPDDLAVGDFDRDGDLDLAVCNKLTPTGSVTILVNDGVGGFSTGASPAVGNTPTSIAVADFDRNGTLDLAVANNLSRDLTVRFGDGAGGFGAPTTLPLHTLDSGPVSVTAVDLDGDGDLDLATAAFGSNAINVFENVGGAFPGSPVRRPSSYPPIFVATADINRDGQADLVMADDGTKVLRGRGSLDPEPAEHFLAGRGPVALVVGDLDRDGRPDLAVANSSSDDVSILLSTACAARRLAVSSSPSSCVLGSPYQVAATVETLDEGGNRAMCASGSVVPSIVPGTGKGGAVLTPPDGVDLIDGQAIFDPLTISLDGSRYRLQFDLAGTAPVRSRSFTLGPTLSIVGPASVCPVAPLSHSVDPGLDSYRWTASGFTYGFTPSVTLTSPPLTIDTTYLLAVQARIDGCLLNDSRMVHLGALASVSASVVGSTTVCVDCLGGTATATETGGGDPLSREWGYRTVPVTGPITPIPGQTAASYVVNGLDFPGPGTYYLVETTEPTCGTRMTSNEITLSVEAMVPGGEVRSLGVTSGDFAGSGRNVLQWVNTSGTLEEIRIRWNVAPVGTSLCAPPPDPLSPWDAAKEAVILAPGAATKGTHTHDDLEFDTAYCYSVFSKASGIYSPGRVVKGRPFNTTLGPEKWAYYTGATAVVPPVVTFSGLLAMSNDQTVHSLERGLGGGTWPVAWTPPPSLIGVAHSRSPVVPFAIPVGGASAVLFVGDDAGYVAAVDATSGAPVWGPLRPFDPPLHATITGAPGGTFVQYGGPSDLVLVGTRNNDGGQASQFVALKLADGTVAPGAAFDGLGTPGGGLGPVSGTPAVDNDAGLVYFTSRRLGGTGHSVWCLRIEAAGTLTYVWSRGAFGDVDASPVVRGDRLYVANTTGTIYSINTADPDDYREYPNPDGPVKGFLFPNRSGDELIYASNSSVRSLSDTPLGLFPNWTWDPTGLEPSVILFWPQTTYVYVGAQGGTLYQLDFGAGAPSTTCDPYPGGVGSTCISLVLGDGLGHLGAPTLDIGLVPPVEISPGKAMLYIGSESAGLHAVEVPFP